MIAVRALDLPSRRGSDYPAPHDVPCRERVRRALGDAFGLSQFGVNLLELPPGAWSSQRHWHERQDELVYVLEGEVDAGDRRGRDNAVGRHDRRLSRRLRQWPPSRQPLRHAVARVLEVGTRTAEETAHYSDIDMMYREDADGRRLLHQGRTAL